MELHFPDLGTCYREVNLMVGSTGEVVGTDGVLPPLTIKVDNSVGSIPPEDIGYTSGKIKHLERNYHDPERFKDFYLNPKGEKRPRDQTYHFKTKPRGKNCLLLISYHRVTGEYTIVWRTTELAQRWAADLFWISNLLPGKRLNLMIPYSYQTIQVWAGTAEALGLRPWSGKAKKRYREVYKWARDLYYPRELNHDNLSTWSPVKISQKAVLKSRGL